MNAAQGDAVADTTTGSGHYGTRRSLDFRDKTALDRLVATSALDPTLAKQRRSAAAKHLAREMVRRLDASMSCEVSHARLARALGCSVDTIERAQAVLVANGWLDVERRWVRGHQTCSRYHLRAGFKRLADRREPVAFWQSTNVVHLPERVEESAQRNRAALLITTRKLPASMTRKLRHDPVSPSEGETKNDPPSPSPLLERNPPDQSSTAAGAGGVVTNRSPLPESWIRACRRVFPGCHKPHRHLAHLADGLGYTEHEGLAYLRALDAKRSDLPRHDVAAVLACCGRDHRDPSTPAMGGAKSWLKGRRWKPDMPINSAPAASATPIGRRRVVATPRITPPAEALAFFLMDRRGRPTAVTNELDREGGPPEENITPQIVTETCPRSVP